VVEPLPVASEWHVVGSPLQVAADAVEDECGRECHGGGVLALGVRLPAGEVRVVPAATHLHDGEGCSLSGATNVRVRRLEV
jgi:hypothetical protein